MNIALNGRFYGAHRTGVQRFAIEVARRLLPSSTLFLPAGVAPPPDLPPTCRVHHGRSRGHVWEQLELPALLRSSECECELHMAGTAPIRTRGHVLIVHDLLPLTHGDWFTRRFRLWRWAVLRAAVPRAARIVTVSEWVRDEVLRAFDVPPDRVVVAEQGVEPFDRPAPMVDVARVRQRYGLPERYLLTVGAGDPRKNIPFLGQVLTRWREMGGRPPPLVVAGAPASGLFAPDAGWPAPVDVRAIGHVPDDDLHALYTGAVALCFPSLAEGFGRPPLEAMACGTPAVVGPYAAVPDILEKSGYVRPLRADDWIEALAGVLANGRCEEAGREIAARYRWDAAAETVRRACEAASLERERRT